MFNNLETQPFVQEINITINITTNINNVNTVSRDFMIVSMLA